MLENLNQKTTYSLDWSQGNAVNAYIYLIGEDLC
jgi:hypothetical protein